MNTFGLLSREELERLTADLPDLSRWGSHMLQPFVARRLKTCRVAWINRRWFFERGVDLTNDATDRRMRSWLTCEFGFLVPRPQEMQAVGGEEKVFHADRYGATGAAPHGGSGRAGICGTFQVKGIGVTPLVGIHADWLHSNGCAWLEEGIREAIYSEIALAEFPHGATPVVAILDTGIDDEDATRRLRRALIIRPCVLRPAHLERAVFFKPPADQRLAQLDDVKRTRDAVRTYIRPDASQPCVKDAMELFRSIGEQIAYGHVHRFFHGDFFSSNLALTGALLDHGSTRVLPNWAKAKVLDHSPGFGKEFLVVSAVVKSIVFYFNKYKPATCDVLVDTEIYTAAIEAYNKRFDQECCRIWSVEDAEEDVKNTVSSIMKGYFVEQQQQTVDYVDAASTAAHAWLCEKIDNGFRFADDSATKRVIGGICNALVEKGLMNIECDDRRRSVLLKALRLLAPRACLYREQLQASIDAELSGPCLCADAIQRIVAAAISMGRRDFPELPANLIVHAQISDGVSWALLCTQLSTDRHVVWLKANQLDNRIIVFGRSIPANQLDRYRQSMDACYWYGLFPYEVPGDGARFGFHVVANGHVLPIRGTQWVYSDDPAHAVVFE